MSPGTAARLNFSTFDRADQVVAALQSKQHLTAVPVVDVTAVPAGVVVIDETATLSLGELGGEPHRTCGRAAHCGDAVVGDGAGGAARAGLGARRARRHRPLRRAGGGQRAATGLADGDGGGERRELRRRPHRSPQRHRGAHPSRGGSRLGGRCHHFRSHDAVGRHEDRRCLGGGAARTCRSGGRACRPDLRVPRHHR